MRIALFTHVRDIDGMGCAILTKLFADIEITYFCDYTDVEYKFKSFLANENYMKYHKIIMSDLSMGEFTSLPSIIENDNYLKEHFVLLDHHESSMHLNQYDWAVVKTLDNNTNELTCATKLVYEYFIEYGGFSKQKYIDEFVEHIRLYDTWDWKKVPHIKEPYYLTLLFELWGVNYFVLYFKNMLETKNYSLPNDALFLAQLKEKEILSYVQRKSVSVIEKELQGYRCGIVFAELYRNDIADNLKSKYDIVIIIGDTLSFRTEKDDIDLNKFASKYGGGGHRKTAGGQITLEQKETFISILF